MYNNTVFLFSPFFSFPLSDSRRQTIRTTDDNKTLFLSTPSAYVRIHAPTLTLDNVDKERCKKVKRIKSREEDEEKGGRKGALYTDRNNSI